jgi:tetratricopeptide (TPR) repeat protein
MLLSLVALLAWQPDAAMLGQLYREAFERKKQQYGASDTATIQAARDLGLFLSKHGAAAGAQQVLTEVVRLDEIALGPDARQTLADVAALASVSAPRQAEALWQRAAKSSEQKVAARAFAGLGQLRETAGDQAGAAQYYRQALANQEAALGQATTPREKADLAILLSGVAQVLGQIVDPTEGTAVLRRSFGINRSLLGARHPETATVEANLAGVLLDANAVDESVRLITEAISILEETMGEDHPRVAISATILAHGLRIKGEYARAEQNFRRAVAIDERAYGPKHSQTLSDVGTLAEFLRERGKMQEATALEKRLAIGAK